jgi:hypothetical protein
VQHQAGWRALRAQALVLLLALSASMLGLPGAHADDVSRAQQRVDRLQAVARASTERLEAGTRQWEADRTALQRTRTRLESTRRHVREAAAVVRREQAHVAAVARSLYMSPAPEGVRLAFTRSPDAVVDSIRAHAALDRAAGTQAQVVHRAAVARHRLAQQEQQARALEQHARDLVAGSARRMAELQELARTTSEQLSTAQQQLSRAREAARAARLRAARTRYSGGGRAAYCTRSSTAGQSNGNLDPASLCPLWRAPGHRLAYGAAQAFNRLSQYHAATVGGPLCVTSSYRTYSEQAGVYRSKPGLAAVPGKSEHGWGKAVDLGCGVQSFGSAAHEWMKANAGRFGWYHPDWARACGSRPEAWHWEYGG